MMGPQLHTLGTILMDTGEYHDGDLGTLVLYTEGPP